MITRRRTVLTGLAVLAVFTLTGCAGGTPTPAPPSEPAIGNSSQVNNLSFKESDKPPMQFETGDGEPVEGMNESSWTQLDSGDIEVLLHGSSSCPPAFASAVKEEPSTVVIELEELDEKIACTADLVPYATVIENPGEVENVEIFHKDDGKTTELPKR